MLTQILTSGSEWLDHSTWHVRAHHLALLAESEWRLLFAMRTLYDQGAWRVFTSRLGNNFGVPCLHLPSKVCFNTGSCTKAIHQLLRLVVAMAWGQKAERERAVFGLLAYSYEEAAVTHSSTPSVPGPINLNDWKWRPNAHGAMSREVMMLRGVTQRCQECSKDESVFSCAVANISVAVRGP